MLELKIEALTAAIEQLTRVIVDTQLAREELQMISETVKPVEQVAIEAIEELSAQLPDREELKTKCAELVRANTGNKEKIFNELGKYKAKKVLDLADADLQTFSNFLKGLE